jgi:hypothetical protein
MDGRVETAEQVKNPSEHTEYHTLTVLSFAYSQRSKVI